MDIQHHEDNHQQHDEDDAEFGIGGMVVEMRLVVGFVLYVLILYNFIYVTDYLRILFTSHQGCDLVGK